MTGFDVIARPIGAAAEAQSSSPSAQQQANNITVNVPGASVQAVAGTSTFASDELFPKTAAGRVGRKDYGDNPGTDGGGVIVQDPVEVYNMASMDFSVVNVQPSRGILFTNQLQQFMDDARAQNPDHKIYQYYNLQELGDDLSGPKHDLLVSNLGPPGQLINTNETPSWPFSSWYARDGNGELEAVFQTNLAVNVTNYVVPDAQGRIFGPAYIDDVLVLSHWDPFDPKPDGFFCDVLDYRPRENTLNYSGLPGQDNARTGWRDGGRGQAVATAYRDGQRQGVQRMKNNWGALAGGNCGTWPREQTTTQPQSVLNELGQPDVYTEYKNLCHMGWMESQSIAKWPDWDPNADPPRLGGFGYNGMYSDGTLSLFGTPRMAQNNYNYLMRHLIPPKHCINQWVFHSSSPTKDPVVGSQGVTSAIFSLIRFGFTQTLMDDGMYGLTNSVGGFSATYDRTPIIDEYGFHNTGVTGLSPKWLGRALTTGLSVREWALNDRDPWITTGAEMYQREFENGLAICRWDKPGGSAGDSISGLFNVPVVDGGSLANGEIPGNVFRSFQGVQDPAINDGRTINEANFPSGYPIRRMDGRVFVRI